MTLTLILIALARAVATAALFIVLVHLIAVVFIKVTKQKPYGLGGKYLQKGVWF